MRKKSEDQVRKQASKGAEAGILGRMRQILLPMVAGIGDEGRVDELCSERAMEALAEVLRRDAEELAGTKGQAPRGPHALPPGPNEGRTRVRRASSAGGTPRVRVSAGLETALPSFEASRREDPLAERVVNQILLGVSTRGYEPSLERPLERVRSRGTSKSAASRHLVSETRKKLSSFLSSRLEEVELLALMVDGIEIG